MAPLVRTGGSRHTGLAAPPHRNIHTVCKEEQRKNRKRGQAEKMKYEHITEGRFIDRPNRFIAHVEINGQVETVHVKNTGRCREFLVPGTLKLVFTK